MSICYYCISLSCSSHSSLVMIFRARVCTKIIISTNISPLYTFSGRLDLANHKPGSSYKNQKRLQYCTLQAAPGQKWILDSGQDVLLQFMSCVCYNDYTVHISHTLLQWILSSLLHLYYNDYTVQKIPDLKYLVKCLKTNAFSTIEWHFNLVQDVIGYQ